MKLILNKMYCQKVQRLSIKHYILNLNILKMVNSQLNYWLIDWF